MPQMARLARINDGEWAELDLGLAISPESLWDELESLRDGGANVVVVHGAPGWEPASDWLRKLELFALPTVFAFDGEVSGPAALLALHCDIRVCSEGAWLRLGELGGRRMLALLGQRRVVEVFEAQGLIGAGQALRLGLVSKVTPPGQALAAARDLAGVIASRGPIAVQLGKEAIWRGLEIPLPRGLRFETDLTLLLQTTKDRAEGVAAFLEKRPPRFKGE
jgi:enoyl-CoA hydratase/carnithine racemase